MAKIDEITGKKAARGNTRSFSMNHSRRTWGLNLQRVTIKDGLGKKSVKVSARTLKTLKKQNKVA
jgi:large subunit ribosomal protein L28